MNVLVKKYCELPRVIRRPMWQVWHKLMIRFDKDISVHFMNYGYDDPLQKDLVRLEKSDEPNRYCIQLYDHVVRKAAIAGKDVLEVGSGRGGGASYITRYFKPKSYTGLDISGSIIDFCNQYYNVPGLSFVRGIAEDQPFHDQSFDVVINVESARCYSSLTTFFNEVHRVLRPGGVFLFADMMDPSESGSIRDQLAGSGFQLIQETNITRNVAHALDKDTQRRETLIEQKIPGFLKKSFAQFAGTKGTERYDSFSNGKFVYMSYMLAKI